ncbi:hypothetical protein CEXT_665801 [Caerostris extrusa]|uniref:Uncharacterized protein n=1 Tax=Caerostris extrusa TaxID=172846 RepID=A0AAV4Y9S1_CAEEX|nr:hypothetical protein CEXT_665801 [Caerostris extrusa]
MFVIVNRLYEFLMKKEVQLEESQNMSSNSFENIYVITISPTPNHTQQTFSIGRCEILNCIIIKGPTHSHVKQMDEQHSTTLIFRTLTLHTEIYNRRTLPWT